MRRILKFIIDAGVRPDMPPRQAGAIRAHHVVFLIVLAAVLSTLPLLFQNLPATRGLMISASALALALCLHPALNAWGWHRVAEIYGPSITMCVIAFNSLYLGPWNDLQLQGVILVSFFHVYFLYGLLWITFLGLALFVGVEGWYATGHKGLLEGVAADGFLTTARNVAVYGTVLMPIGLSYYNRAILLATQRGLDRELARSESLLLNILPRKIADRLKNSPQAIADRIPEVSIVFADIVGFTEMSRKMDAEQLVGMLSEIFLGFDRAARRLGLEKIKTIGDAYMVVAGLPEPHPDHANAAVEMALAMQSHMEEVRSRHPDLRLRIGIHAGSVVAGVIGENKFSYDLWGENVNIASRMESHGMPGHVHVSEAFARAAGHRWRFEPRGAIEIKGQGPMQTYFLTQAAGE